jgi:cytoskeletal protein CcmA (bactofilin family)
MAIGRIGGPLLKSNLLRNGIDLAFETDLLYLDVTNSRIGVNTVAPTTELDVNGTIRSTNIVVDNNVTIGDFTIYDNVIESSSGIIRFEAAAGEATIYHAKLQIDAFQISGNTLATITTNTSLEIQPDGLGTVNINSSTNITGDLGVTGNINVSGNVTIGGDITIGDQTTDTITVNARINSNLIPNADITYDLGTSELQWNNLYLNNAFISNQVQVADFTFSGNTISTSEESITFATPSGQAVVFNTKLLVDDIEIVNNRIATTTTDTNLEIQADGTGTIELQSPTNITGNLNVTGNIDATGNVTIGGNIIIGDELTDSITINASIRSDLIPETDNIYDLGSEDYRWANLYVTNFITNTITLPTLNVGNITFNDNEISTGTGQDLYIDGNGTGGVRLGNFRIVDNVITNLVSGVVSEITQSGLGYLKIAGTNGFVPPVGNNAQRPTVALYGTIPQGMTRYNTQSKALEIWDGVTWSSPAGASGAVSEIQANDISAAFAIALG